MGYGSAQDAEGMGDSRCDHCSGPGMGVASGPEGKPSAGRNGSYFGRSVGTARTASRWRCGSLAGREARDGWSRGERLRARSSRAVAAPDATIEYYRRLVRLEREFPKDRWITVRFDERVADPFVTVERIYAQLGLPMSAEAARAIGEGAAAAARQRSRGHDDTLEEFGLTREAIHEPLREVFEACGFEA